MATANSKTSRKSAARNPQPVKMIPIPAEVADGMCARLCGLQAIIRCVQLSLENDADANAGEAAEALHTVADLISTLMVDVDVAIWGQQPEVAHG